MAKLARLWFLLPLISLFLSLEATSAQPSANADANPPDAYPTDFIEVSCKSATRYPSLCIDCLSSYARFIRQSDQALARVALSVTMSRTKQALAYVVGLRDIQGITPREYSAVGDCITNLGGSVDRLSKSIDEMDQMAKAGPGNGDDFEWHVSNLQTWISGALTNADTCFDGFAGRDMDGNIKTMVRSKVLDLAQVISNALALTDQFVSRHKGSALGHP